MCRCLKTAICLCYSKTCTSHFHLHGFSLLGKFLDSVKYMNFSESLIDKFKWNFHATKFHEIFHLLVHVIFYRTPTGRLVITTSKTIHDILPHWFRVAGHHYDTTQLQVIREYWRGNCRTTVIVLEIAGNRRTVIPSPCSFSPLSASYPPVFRTPPSAAEVVDVKTPTADWRACATTHREGSVGVTTHAQRWGNVYRSRNVITHCQAYGTTLGELDRSVEGEWFIIWGNVPGVLLPVTWSVTKFWHENTTERTRPGERIRPELEDRRMDGVDGGTNERMNRMTGWLAG